MTNGDVDHGLESQLRHACADLDRRLRAGQRCLAEDFFEQFPALASRAEAAVELIYTEFFTREELGQAPAPDEYYQRFPRWRTLLQEQLQIHALLRANERPCPAGGPLTTIQDLSAAMACPGRSVGAYELLEETARGAMGVVYKARHRALKRVVALKMVLAGPHAGAAAFERFRTEAEAIARLHHPNIVQIYDIGAVQSYPYLALEFVQGGNLAQKLMSKPVPAEQAACLIATLARAIHYAHDQGILHRDLKPANVLLTPDDTPKITDFGMAKLLDRSSGQTASGALCGTPCYMAPEQAACRSERIGPAVDIYALGAILYELLTGRPPFRADSLLQTLNQVVSREPVSPNRGRRTVPRDLALICMKCLEKDPRRRYRSAAALADDLDRFRAGMPIQARPLTKPERMWRWAKRRPAVAALLFMLMLAALTLLAGNCWYTFRLDAVAAEAQEQREQARAAARQVEQQKQEANVAIAEARRGERVARAVAEEAVRQKKATFPQATPVKGDGELSRRLLFSLQLAQVAEVWQSDPVQARRLLLDQKRCPRDLRDFAWGMYHRLCNQDRLLASGYARGVHAVAVSPDGAILAMAGANEPTVKLWDIAKGRERAVLKAHSGSINGLAFAPDGRLLATAGEDHTIRLWFTDSGKKYKTLRGHSGAVTAVAFAGNGKSLASGSADQTARQWDIDTGKELRALQGHGGAVRSVAFAPDGETLATGGDDKTVRFWDLLTLADDKQRNALKLDEQGAITCLAFSPDGKKLAVAGARRTAVDLFDMDTYVLKTSFRGHVDQVHGISFSRDGRLLASGSRDSTVRVWEVDAGAQRLAFQAHSPVWSVAFLAGKDTLVSAGADANVRLWDVGVRMDFQGRTPDQPATWTGRIMAMACAPDGKTFVTGDHDGLVKLCDRRTQKPLMNVRGHAGAVWGVTFFPDSKIFATCGEDGKVKLWDVDQRRKLVTLLGPGPRVRALALAPDGKTLATGGADGQLKLWDVAARRQRTATSHRGGEILALGFSPAGESLAVGSADGTVRLLDSNTLAPRLTLAKHDKAVLFTLFSPDGKTLATGGLDSTVHLWDTHTFTRRATLLWNAGYVFSAAFTGESKNLVAGGGSREGGHLPGEVKIWDVTTGQCHATVPGQTGPVAFSSKSRELLTVAHDASVKTWPATFD